MRWRQVSCVLVLLVVAGDLSVPARSQPSTHSAIDLNTLCVREVLAATKSSTEEQEKLRPQIVLFCRCVILIYSKHFTDSQIEWIYAREGQDRRAMSALLEKFGSAWVQEILETLRIKKAEMNLSACIPGKPAQ